MPTRQPLSSNTGEPRWVASKIASGVAGTEAGFAGVWGLGRWGKREWGVWATICTVPQRAANIKIWNVRRKISPCFRVFSTLLQTRAGSKEIDAKFFRAGLKGDSIAPCE
jgi:hypothetical protein